MEAQHEETVCGIPRVNPDPQSTFWSNFGKFMIFMEMAINSLDHLNEQILQFVFSPAHTADDNETGLTPGDREKLKASLTLMRTLLVDAQTTFKKMVADNRRLASRIDNSIQEANHEVHVLKAELADTSRKINEMAPLKTSSDPAISSQSSLSQPECLQLHELAILREENQRLRSEIRLLHTELADIRSHDAVVGTDENRTNSYKTDLIQTRQDLSRTKEAVQAMKSDRKRLKSEKLELLSQMKQLYCTLEDKESELRDFIRNYEQRMRESDESIKQLALEREGKERLLQTIEDAAKHTSDIQQQSHEKDELIRKLQAELYEANEKLKSQGLSTIKSTTSSSSGDSMLKPTTAPSGPDDTYNEAVITPPSDVIPLDPASSSRSVRSSASILSGSSGYHGSLENVRRGSVNRDSLAKPGPHASRQPAILRHNNGGEYVIFSDVKLTRNKKRSKSPGAFTRIFGKSRSRRSVATTDHSAIRDGDFISNRLSVLNQENYEEKLQILDECCTLHMGRWRAGHVLAWVEIDMNMPMYGAICVQNIKSGQVLLGLSDSELDSALDLKSPLHRRKLRLAIEEHREPDAMRYPAAGRLDHTWTAHRWTADLGLTQYRAVFEQHLIDGRLLNVLTKKDLERHLGITRKFHQNSILHGIELLRMLNFNKEMLNERRGKCDNEDIDPIVWTNQRVLTWLQSIDLHEYVGCVPESGLHGAVLVLDPNFNLEAFANLLGIPANKSYVRRHLATEFETLVRPARAVVETPFMDSKKKSSSLSRESGKPLLQRSFKRGDKEEETPKRLSLRGSFSRALGKKVREGLDQQSKTSGICSDQNVTSEEKKTSNDQTTPRAAHLIGTTV